MNKEIKNDLEFFSSLFVLIAGIVLLFVGIFIQPKGEIHYTVLVAVGELLTFVGACWRIAYKYKDYMLPKK